jgi:hypothetical protein
MTLKEAKKLIRVKSERRYRIHFEWVDGALLRGDTIPDFNTPDEPPFKSAEEARTFAYRFAGATKGQAVNIHLCEEDGAGNHICVVPGFEIKNRVG